MAELVEQIKQDNRTKNFIDDIKSKVTMPGPAFGKPDVDAARDLGKRYFKSASPRFKGVTIASFMVGIVMNDIGTATDVLESGKFQQAYRKALIHLQQGNLSEAEKAIYGTSRNPNSSTISMYDAIAERNERLALSFKTAMDTVFGY
ncbi:MAG: hypothetical protein KatS3mg110_2150 [Pirellulaceae bacterium]|nr:MAG: hypothetical protein KatS3mg110_2150 [Pirellulaceae bacterium]